MKARYSNGFQTILQDFTSISAQCPLGTSISFAKFIFLPHGKSSQTSLNNGSEEKSQVQPGFWWAMVILLGGLIAANVVYLDAYTTKNIVKPLATIAIGWLAYLLIFKKSVIKLPRTIEKFDHQIGIMSLMLILLFWIVWAQSRFLI